MPIKFRCPHCRQFLGISRAKAGGIADCPMCGKSVRVPNLDGTVKPLPKPKLDLQDSSLVDALGELAGIGSEDETIDSDLSVPEQQLKSPAVRPTAEPIALQPLLPAKPVAAAEIAVERPAKSVPTGNRSPQNAPSSDELEALVLDEPKRGTPTRTATSKDSRRKLATRAWPAWWPIAALAATVVLAVAGFLLTRSSSVSPSDVADQQSNKSDAQPQITATPADDGITPAVTGRVTYVSEAGDTRPDEGAKVIALPSARAGTVKFDVAGFMVGSDKADAEVAAASLRALGGDMVVADEQGHYALRLPAAGEFRLLIISRHQSRRWEVGVEADVQKLLDQFFIRPSTLLGQLAYDVQQFSYRGQGTSPRDVAFTRE